MNLADLIERLTSELDLDLSSDSEDGYRNIFAVIPGQDSTPRLVDVRIDEDGDIVLEF